MRRIDVPAAANENRSSGVLEGRYDRVAVAGYLGVPVLPPAFISRRPRMENTPNAASLFAAHPRSFDVNRYVYPVLSRRSGGISIGVNLNLDKICNFDCIYCQVDRSSLGPKQKVDVARLVEELTADGGIDHLGTDLRGDEVSRHAPAFAAAQRYCLERRRRAHHIPQFRRDRRRLRRSPPPLGPDGHETGVDHQRHHVSPRSGTPRAGDPGCQPRRDWAKLDAGSDAYYRQIDRTSIPFSRILDNLVDAARVRPIVIQSLFMRVRGIATPPAEQEAYCQRISEIMAAGGKIQSIQVHTVARQPAESWVSPLSDAEVDALAALVRERTGLPVAAYYGA